MKDWRYNIILCESFIVHFIFICRIFSFQGCILPSYSAFPKKIAQFCLNLTVGSHNLGLNA
jgi:hypothetical protein